MNFLLLGNQGLGLGGSVWCLRLQTRSVQVQHAGLGHGLAQGQETEGGRQTLNTEPGELTPEWGSLFQAGDLVQTVP